MTEQAAESMSKARGKGQVGRVVSKSGDKTVSVIVNYLVKHATYGKYVRRRTKVAVHDPENKANKGDMVEVTPCRRLSKNKSWRLVRIVRPTVVK